MSKIGNVKKSVGVTNRNRGYGYFARVRSNINSADLIFSSFMTINEYYVTHKIYFYLYSHS